MGLLINQAKVSQTGGTGRVEALGHFRVRIRNILLIIEGKSGQLQLLSSQETELNYKKNGKKYKNMCFSYFKKYVPYVEVVSKLSLNVH